MGFIAACAGDQGWFLKAFFEMYNSGRTLEMPHKANPAPEWTKNSSAAAPEIKFSLPKLLNGMGRVWFHIFIKKFHFSPFFIPASPTQQCTGNGGRVKLDFFYSFKSKASAQWGWRLWGPQIGQLFKVEDSGENPKNPSPALLLLLWHPQGWSQKDPDPLSPSLLRVLPPWLRTFFTLHPLVTFIKPLLIQKSAN